VYFGTSGTTYTLPCSSATTTSTTTTTTTSAITTSTTTSTTTLAFAAFTVRTDISTATICTQPTITVYTNGNPITTGTQVFTTSSLLVPYIGADFIVDVAVLDIYAIGSGNGVVGLITGLVC
jgi:hypothetical protein